MNHPCPPRFVLVCASFVAASGLCTTRVLAQQNPAAPAKPAATATPQVSPETPPAALHEKLPPQVSPGVRMVEYDRAAFRPDPQYAATFSHQQQIDTYGAKSAVTTQRPLLEWGRELYLEGPLRPGTNVIGSKNRFSPHFMVYGDWRSAAGYNDVGRDVLGRAATRLNLDIDAKLTATERVHAFMRPFDKNGQFMSYDFAGPNRDERNFQLDANLDTLFFEGDIGAITAGATGNETKFDLPFVVGKFPLLVQNGVWIEDAFTGVAFTIPANNSPHLDISNFDVTFFAALDDVSSPAVSAAGGDDHDSTVFGVTSFIDVAQGYAEVGYGYTAGSEAARDIDYHNLTAAFTRRYGEWLSNSVRVIANVGQDKTGPDTADGFMFLMENSLVTDEPYTFIPYLNMFVGFGTPQSLLRAADAGGVLKNTGINFEADALTGFPKIDDTGHDTFGAALGVNYLFDLEQRRQLVLEIAGEHPFGSDASAPGDEFALGARYQIALDNSWILRFDAMVANIDDGDNVAGLRFEIRKKF